MYHVLPVLSWHARCWLGSAHAGQIWPFTPSFLASGALGFIVKGRVCEMIWRGAVYLILVLVQYFLSYVLPNLIARCSVRSCKWHPHWTEANLRSPLDQGGSDVSLSEVYRAWCTMSEQKTDFLLGCLLRGHRTPRSESQFQKFGFCHCTQIETFGTPVGQIHRRPML